MKSHHLQREPLLIRSRVDGIHLSYEQALASAKARKPVPAPKRDAIGRYARPDRSRDPVLRAFGEGVGG